MNVAFYLGDFKGSGGTERACISVANELSEYGEHKISLIVTNNASEESFFEISRKVELIYLDVKNVKRQYFTLIKRLRSSIKRNDIDVLVSVESMALLFLIPIYYLSRISRTSLKLVNWEHFNSHVNLDRKLRDYCRRWAAKNTDGVVVLTQRDKELWHKKFAVKAEIQVINNPSPFVVSDNNYKPESRKIIAIGRLTYQKGFDVLIDLWADFQSRYEIARQWKLQIIGSGKDEALLKEKINTYKLNDTIDMIPNTDNIAAYYRDASFLVMTSRFEGLPMTLIEAQSFGLPIIAYDCLTGPSEVISTNSGFLIDQNDSQDFLEKLNVLISDEELRKSMSACAKREVIKYDKENVTKLWGSFLKQI